VNSWNRLYNPLVISALALVAACSRSPTTNQASPAPSAAAPAASAAAASNVATPQATSATFPPPGAPWGVKAGMPYKDARQQLLQHGFAAVPVKHAADENLTTPDDPHVKAFPEVIQCSGTGNGLCHFLFQVRADGRYLEVETAGEYEDDVPGGGVVNDLYLTTIKNQPANGAPSPDDIGDGPGGSILLAFTPWEPNDKVIDELLPGSDRPLVEAGDSKTYVFEGATFLRKFRQAGFVVRGFDRKLLAAEGNERVDLTSKDGTYTISIFLVSGESSVHYGTTTIVRIEAGGDTFSDASLKEFLKGFLGVRAKPR
jgi:hypothetical protein